LLGPSTLTLELGRIYDDPGFTAIDNVDGNVKRFVVVQGGSGVTIKPVSLGTYTISYNVTDKAGNKAIEQLRTINVIEDQSPPVFTGEYTKKITEGTTRAITLIARDLTGVTYSIEGADADKFNLNPSTGIVEFKVTPIYETQKVYKFTAKATDGKHESSQEVVINITQKLIAQDNDFTIFSSLEKGAIVGTATVINGTASSFILTNHTDKFSMSANGTIKLEIPAIQLTETPYTLNYHAIDENGNETNTSTITVNVKS